MTKPEETIVKSVISLAGRFDRDAVLEINRLYEL
jgi:hypothetical protein